jgi:uncharacterized HhH-GPD family protein
MIVKRLLIQKSILVQSRPSPSTLGSAWRFAFTVPNAFLFAVIFDHQIPYERAWIAPHVLKKRLGHFSMKRIASMNPQNLETVIRGDIKGQCLHRFPRKMSEWLTGAATKLVNEYEADARRIWSGRLRARTVLERLEAFPGISQKKAHMTAAILNEQEQREFCHASLSGWEEINVAVDVHVRRVWKRAGLGDDLSITGIMERASELYPDYPGALDEPLWQIGMFWCKPGQPDCEGALQNGLECWLEDLCPKILE